ncbi:MAG TPA: hypothetical protein VGR02_17845 [Thermoanaerobaculia bacterium]|jgi:hypothetical protein|nr:hypothetical protein [Thermoanaerobaculia bacterium]
MRAYGSDRLQVDGDRLLISSRIPKGWQARIGKTLTSPEHPGTAVLWDGECYEVLDVQPLPQGYRYTLALWGETHAIRLTDRYDEESEGERVAEHRRGIMRERKRTAANLLALFAGQLPASIQNHLGSELGILPARLTLISTITDFAIVAAAILYSAHLRTTFRIVPPWLFLTVFYFGIQFATRLTIALLQNRPVGTVFGLIAYLFVPKLAADPGKGNAVPMTAAPEDVALQDFVLMREPYITLLSTREQLSIARRFQYDYTRQSSNVAAALLLIAILGLVSSWSTLRHDVRPTALASLLTALALAVEQVWRLVALKTRPAGSVLGLLVRPFLKRLI